MHVRRRFDIAEDCRPREIDPRAAPFLLSFLSRPIFFGLGLHYSDEKAEAEVVGMAEGRHGKGNSGVEC